LAQPKIQTSFASGEWTPELFARVDLQKYHNGAALLRNFFVDYHGGASTRMGTRYVLQAFKSATKVRLIPFQVSQTIGYVLEFGDHYIRFHINGAPVLESTIALSGFGPTNPALFGTSVNHGYSIGDWVFISGSGHPPQANGRYFQVRTIPNPAQFTISDLNGNPVDGSTWAGFISGSSVQRVYTISSPYAAADLALVKFAQSVTQMMLTHPSYQPQVLTINSATNWTIAAINFSPTVAPPTLGSVTTNLPAGTFIYGYVVTAVDSNGTESAPSNVSSITSLAWIGSSQGSNTLTWSSVTGAASYNVYKALPITAGSLPTSTQFGFIGNVAGLTFVEAYPGIAPDFAQTPPIVQGAFTGGSVNSVTVTGAGSYTSVPTVTFPSAPAGGVSATGFASLGVTSTGGIHHGSGSGYDIAINGSLGGDPVGSTLTFPNGVVLTITSTAFLSSAGVVTFWNVNGVSILNPGSISSGSAPSNPVSPTGCSAPGFLSFGTPFSIDLGWGVKAVTVQIAGSGYTSGGSLTFSPAGASATFTVTPITGGPSAQNPAVVSFFQQRMFLGATNGNLQGFSFSQPGAFFNFNTSIPVQADDSIQGSIISGQLNQIKSAVSVPTGLMTFTSRGAWLLNGAGGVLTPTSITATPQAVVGASDIPPIQVNYDALYVQAKGYYVRDITFNFYVQVYTGNDISTLSSHLFFGYQLTEWTWAEEPFKTVWCVRSDGVALSLAYVKEQETLGWAHHDTNGQFMSVTSVVESITNQFASTGPTQILVDGVYWVVQRVVNGVTVQYIERMADRIFPYGVEDAWCVDAGLQSVQVVTNPNTTLTFSAASGNGVTVTANNAVFGGPTVGNVIRTGNGVMTITIASGTTATVNITQPITFVNPYTGLPWPAIGGTWAMTPTFTTFTGLDHLIGQQVVGLADGTPVGPLTVTYVGGVASVTLPNAASKVTLGLAFTPQLQTLQLDLGEPTVQGKRKKISACTVRVKDALGLQFGTSFTTLVTMKDFIIGNVGSASNKIVTGLVTADARTIADPLWQVPGQYCLQQPLPYPATILGVIPEIEVGDTPK
jgi:hypothetical protein